MESASTPALLLLNLPAQALAGIDLLSFTVTPRFRGVKDLPPGFHFVFAGTSTAFSERHGLWFRVPPKSEWNGSPPLFVAKWNAETETLEVETDEAEILRWRANLGSLWREGLAPYRQTAAKSRPREAEDEDEDEDEAEEETNDWPILTSHITTPLLSRILSPNPANWHLTSASSATRDLEDIPGLDPSTLQTSAVSELHLLPIDLKQTWRTGATGRERTEFAQDRSWALQNLLPTSNDNGETVYTALLGELQFTFLMVLTLNNFSCLEQWKRLLSLILTCTTAVPKNPEFFISSLAALRLQLQHCRDAEAGLIDLSDEGGNLLKSLLVRFRRGLENLPPSSANGTSVADVLDELEDLEDWLRREQGWEFSDGGGGGHFVREGMLELEDGEVVRGVKSGDFDAEDETGEFAPAVVELTAEQAKLLGVTVQGGEGRGERLGEREEGLMGEVQDEGDESSSVGEDEEEMQDLEEMDPRM